MEPSALLILSCNAWNVPLSLSLIISSLFSSITCMSSVAVSSSMSLSAKSLAEMLEMVNNAQTSRHMMNKLFLHFILLSPYCLIDVQRFFQSLHYILQLKMYELKYKYMMAQRKIVIFISNVYKMETKSSI